MRKAELWYEFIIGLFGLQNERLKLVEVFQGLKLRVQCLCGYPVCLDEIWRG